MRTLFFSLLIACGGSEIKCFHEGTNVTVSYCSKHRQYTFWDGSKLQTIQICDTWEVSK